MRLPLIIAVSLSVCFARGPDWLNDYMETKEKRLLRATTFTPTLRWRKAFEDGHGTVPYFADASALPKRIGVAFFQVHDPATVEVSRALYSRSASGTATTNAMAVTIATGLLEQSKDDLKKVFGDGGMELLFLDEILDTDEKKALYLAFKPEATGLLKAASKVMERVDDAGSMGVKSKLKQTAAAQGYAAHEFLFEDHKTCSGLGVLAEALGLDAILVVHNVITTDKKNSFLNSIFMGLYGPNPVDKIEGHRYVGIGGAAYNDGLAYVAVTHDLNKNGPAAIMTITKNKRAERKTKGKFTFTPNYDGYNKVIGFVSKEVVSYLQKCPEGAEK